MILATLNDINKKLDLVGFQDTPGSTRETTSQLSASTGGRSPIPLYNAVSSVASGQSGEARRGKSLSTFNIPERSGLEGHKLLAWPAIQSLLQCDMSHLQEWDGIELQPERWLVGVTESFGSREPCIERVDFFYNDAKAAQRHDRRAFNMSDQTIRDLCTAYFSSFHCTYPVLDPHLVYKNLIPKFCKQLFDESDECSALMLMILALGSVAKEGARGHAIVEPRNGRQTGLRGGSAELPPGALFLSEAKRRMGITITHFNITSLQSYILLA